MSGFLLGVPGKLKTLLDRLTAGRAANLDQITSTRMARMDTTVGSRATNAGVWTNGTRTLTSAPSPIKSIQSGVYEETLSGESMGSRDVTISAVTAAKSVVFVRGGWTGTGSTFVGTLAKAGEVSSHELLRAELTSSTNLRFTPGSWALRYRVEWTVVEFN